VLIVWIKGLTDLMVLCRALGYNKFNGNFFRLKSIYLDPLAAAANETAEPFDAVPLIPMQFPVPEFATVC
jgi:hypothetical protein